ncbi:MAG TPA: cyclopropane-fatty-acyl-phospholipid synthase family protein [Vicinamibacteria bacterium]|nr:cyclopropane-fatty-acyl-phospholipid synthase family protein [Vicinamibacteria bacterium]
MDDTPRTRTIEFLAAGPVRGRGAARAAGRFDRWVLGRMRARLQGIPLRVTLWDGTSVRLADAAEVAEVVVKDRRTLLALVRDPAVGFGDGYAGGRLEVRGDLVRLLEAVYGHWQETRVGQRPEPPRPEPSGREQARANIHYHYDLGNDFYRLWLDEQLVYTCAYFPTPGTPLEEAQTAKFDHVCRKVRLRPGETVVEAGCGWGALALHMARHYGVTVKAYNISREQIRFARARAKAEGLEGRVEFVEDDYRNVRGRCDVFLSVGMLEHVGQQNYRAFAEVIDRCLGADGRGLLHFIGRDRPRALNAWIRKRIFPGAYPPTLGEVAREVLEPAALTVVDVENLRLHYALTLRHWRARFEEAKGRVAEMFDETFVRAWRLYLAGSEVGFTTGYLQLFQLTFTRGAAETAWTRADLYR